MDNNNNKKELSLHDKIRLIQKENISNSEKQKKISELFQNKNKNNLKKLEEEEYKCKHYKRKCLLYSPCCNKLVTCRICHDKKNLCSMKFDRFSVKKIKCKECSTDQIPSNKCIKCNIEFSNNFCNICNLWTNKLITHCNDCGFCRVLSDKDDKIFHCKRCDTCYSEKFRDSHTCIPKKISSREDKCPICLIKLHDSVKSTIFMNCGHCIHHECYSNYVNSGNYKCPLCKKSLFDMKSHWDHLRSVKENINIPDEYKDIKLKIYCNDCEKQSDTEYCIDGLLECKNCGAFNTQKI